MDVSIVIVNYNVKHFLHQCLQSVYDAAGALDIEVFVVDNKSVDGSQEMVQQQFPKVHLIANTENVGFSKANNQAIRQCSGQYVLLLNPDTVLQEDTLQACVNALHADDSIGGLGVKMIDGSGAYLPESKRGLPSPATAFWKMTGMAAMFPKSKLFARYYLGHLNAEESHYIEVLSGAFMFMRKDALAKAGLLDEDFFMYGEDIDLSYRILKAGYKNYYLASTQIIHYKGESTKKGSLNYVRVFYQAMILYAQKHFKGNNAALFVSVIKLAVYAKAFLALVVTLWKKLWKPLLEMAFIAGAFMLTSLLYQEYRNKIFPADIVQYAPWIQSLLIVLCAVFAGSYQKNSSFKALNKTALTGFLASGFLYALLPEGLRFSRFLVLGNALLVWPLLLTLRKVLDQLRFSQYFVSANKRILVVGTGEAADDVVSKLSASHTDMLISKWFPPNYNTAQLRSMEIELQERVRIHKVDELLFLNDSLKNEWILAFMTVPFSREITFKILPKTADFIIGSGSKDQPGELNYLETEPLFSKTAIRKKTAVDALLSLLVVVCLPYLLFFNQPKALLKAWILVVFGSHHWIGLNQSFRATLLDTNAFCGILTVAPANLSQEDIISLNRAYCKQYRLRNDLWMFWKRHRNLVP